MVNSSDFDELKKLEKQLKQDIYIEKNPVNAVNLVISHGMFREHPLIKDLLALAYFEKGEYEKAGAIYSSLGKKYQEGFCSLLCGNETGAKNAWYSSPENPAIMWGKALLGFINLRVDFVPSYLQIRNFLESTLNYFLISEQTEFAENLINCQEVFSRINLEVYKFIGRSLFNNGFKNLSAEFFIKSKENIPDDPEIYYYLGLYSHYTKDFYETKRLMNKCLDLNSSFTPAKAFLKNLSDDSANQ